MWLFCETELISCYLAMGEYQLAGDEYSYFRHRGSSISSDVVNEIGMILSMASRTASMGGVAQGRSHQEDLGQSITPVANQLMDCYPNPFNPSTTIYYDIADDSHVYLAVYDVVGRLVEILVDQFQIAGNKSIKFDAHDVPSGVYFYRLQAKNYSAMKKMMVLK